MKAILKAYIYGALEVEKAEIPAESCQSLSFNPSGMNEFVDHDHFLLALLCLLDLAGQKHGRKEDFPQLRVRKCGGLTVQGVAFKV